MSLICFGQVLQVAEAVSLEQERNSMSTAGGLCTILFFFYDFHNQFVLHSWPSISPFLILYGSIGSASCVLSRSTLPSLEVSS